MKKILITGANGQLGNEVRSLESRYSQFNYIYSDLPEVDITNMELLEFFVSTHKPDVIINCAAYTDVDKAESEIEVAEKVNVFGPRNLAAVSKKVDAKFIHISTDFVYDGRQYRPYLETDLPSPVSIYGKTKLDGEHAVLKENAQALIFRTSWLYSNYGSNFMKTMIRLATERERLSVIFDQIGTPTWAHDLAETLLHIIATNEDYTHKQGVFHYSNEGVASWYDFAFEIMQLGEIDCEVIPICTAGYPSPATRPHYSVMDKTKVKKDFNISINHWKHSLKNCLQQSLKNKLVSK